MSLIIFIFVRFSGIFPCFSAFYRLHSQDTMRNFLLLQKIKQKNFFGIKINPNDILNHPGLSQCLHTEFMILISCCFDSSNTWNDGRKKKMHKIGAARSNNTFLLVEILDYWYYCDAQKCIEPGQQRRKKTRYTTTKKIWAEWKKWIKVHKPRNETRTEKIAINSLTYTCV